MLDTADLDRSRLSTRLCPYCEASRAAKDVEKLAGIGGENGASPRQGFQRSI